MRTKLFLFLIPLLFLGQARAGDPGRKWRISVGWSYFLTNSSNKPWYYNLDPYLYQQKGPNNWFFPSLGFEYRFKPKWAVSTEVTVHPYMLITKYLIGRDIFSWNEGKHSLGLGIGPTLSWSSKTDAGFNYKFDEYGPFVSNPFPILFGADMNTWYKLKIGHYVIKWSLSAWFSQSYISINGKPIYDYWFYYGYMSRSYYNNPINDFFVAEAGKYQCYCGNYRIKSVFLQGVLIGISLSL